MLPKTTNNCSNTKKFKSAISVWFCSPTGISITFIWSSLNTISYLNMIEKKSFGLLVRHIVIYRLFDCYWGCVDLVQFNKGNSSIPMSKIHRSIERNISGLHTKIEGNTSTTGGKQRNNRNTEVQQKINDNATYIETIKLLDKNYHFPVSFFYRYKGRIRLRDILLRCACIEHIRHLEHFYSFNTWLWKKILNKMFYI